MRIGPGAAPGSVAEGGGGTPRAPRGVARPDSRLPIASPRGVPRCDPGLAKTGARGPAVRMRVAVPWVFAHRILDPLAVPLFPVFAHRTLEPLAVPSVLRAPLPARLPVTGDSTPARVAALPPRVQPVQPCWHVGRTLARSARWRGLGGRPPWTRGPLQHAHQPGGPRSGGAWRTCPRSRPPRRHSSARCVHALMCPRHLADSRPSGGPRTYAPARPRRSWGSLRGAAGPRGGPRRPGVAAPSPQTRRHHGPASGRRREGVGGRPRRGAHSGRRHFRPTPARAADKVRIKVVAPCAAGALRSALRARGGGLHWLCARLADGSQSAAAVHYFE